VREAGVIGSMDRQGRTFYGIASFQVLAMFRRGLFYTYLSIYLRFFLGLSVTETTFFATFPMILNILFQTFVWGVISDKLQRRRTLIILGEASAAVTTCLVWFAHTLPDSSYVAGYVIIAGLSVVEIFWSMSNVAWSALISDIYPEYQRTAIQGRLASIGAGGRLAGVWIGGLAYDGLARYYEGWGFDKGLLFFVASGVMLISTIPMFFVPEGGVSLQQGTQKEEKPDDKIDPAVGARPRSWTAAYSRKFLIFLLAMVLINFGRNCVVTIKNQYLVLDAGFNVSSNLLGYIVNMQSIAVLLGGLTIVRLSKRMSDEVLLFLGSLAAAIHLIGFILATSLPVIFVSNFLAGIADVVIMASSYSYASRLIPASHRGKQFAMYNATLFLSWGVAATIIAGPIVDLLIRSGATQGFSYRMSFLAGAVLVTVGIVVLAVLNRTSTDAPRKSRGS
jgi:MFS family permease